MLKGLFLMGLPLALVFIPLAVLVLGKGHQPPSPSTPNTRLVMPIGQWGWKMGLIALAYLLLYFGAGYFIAWQNPELRAFYGGTDPGSFLLQMKYVIQEEPWLVAFQVLRAGLWVLFALPVIRMTGGTKAWKTALVLGLLYAIPVNIGLLMANPLMPSNSVRLTHMVETISSTFVLGLIVGWLLFRKHSSLADLVGLGFNTSDQRDKQGLRHAEY
jgi:hypothetical protein